MHVRSSFTWEPGTWIVEEDPTMEEAVVSAITDDTSEAKITVGGVPDRPGVAATTLSRTRQRGINVDMIVQNTSAKGMTDISFTVAKTDLEAARDACDKVKEEIGATEVTTDDNIGRVTIVGAGMKSSPGVTALMFETLYGERHQHRDDLDEFDSNLVRAARREGRRRRAYLHTAFGLDAVEF
jgi:aspartate kinase